MFISPESCDTTALCFHRSVCSLLARHKGLSLFLRCAEKAECLDTSVYAIHTSYSKGCENRDFFKECLHLSVSKLISVIQMLSLWAFDGGFVEILVSALPPFSVLFLLVKTLYQDTRCRLSFGQEYVFSFYGVIRSKSA